MLLKTENNEKLFQDLFKDQYNDPNFDYPMGYNITPKFYGKEKKYAVVQWFNYRKEHQAGCLAVFEKYEDADFYAYKAICMTMYNRLSGNYININDQDFNKLQEILKKKKITSELSKDDQDTISTLSEKYTNFYISSEDEITDLNGPGCSNYDSIVSYGNSKDGYSTRYYCVVEYFYGIENRWNFDEKLVKVVNSSWSPKYTNKYDD